eukprot:TRINITY_DN102754_c0_g1_i1.p1 TRINITY_DN102754_c0_g1~~TRINITY_DN102754_c0_g1_i1.p1  ORF type:complete len:342 (+),score=60.56 TRINITY_DN102754_c0_g1_i1:86-1111(+)
MCSQSNGCNMAASRRSFISCCFFLLGTAESALVLRDPPQAQALAQTVEGTALAFAAAGPEPGHSTKSRDGLFCFIVIAAEFGDVPRAKNILDHDDKDAGFSGCDEFRIYSNMSYIKELSAHHRCNNCVEQAIKGSMDVPFGRPDHTTSWAPTALNVPIFLQVWKHVFSTAPYQEYAWTVKTEVDVVFAASHLRNYLLALPPIVGADGNDQEAFGHKADEPAATRLSEQAAFGYNAGDGLHGPIEALTSRAVAAYAAKPEVCDKVAEDNTDKGEDWWLDLCMGALGVRGVKQEQQLLDEGSSAKFVGQAGHKFSHCDPGIAAYHPRKEIDSWNGCYAELTSR